MPTMAFPPRSLATAHLLSAFALVLLLALVAPADAPAATSASYPDTVFSDGFEAGGVGAWDGARGNGLVSVTPSAAHTGSEGAQISNLLGQAALIVKKLPQPVTASS